MRFIYGSAQQLGPHCVVDLPSRTLLDYALATGSDHQLDAQSVALWNTTVTFHGLSRSRASALCVFNNITHSVEKVTECWTFSLRCTPAMAAGVTDRLWEVSDLVALLEADERGLERAA